MTEIVLTSDQSYQIANATDGIVFCDAAGQVIVRVPPILTEEESTIVNEAKRPVSVGPAEAGVCGRSGAVGVARAAMTRYSVVYVAEAEEELATIWENSSDRSQVANAANLADQALASSPENRAVYLGEELWRLDIAPLRFYFAIREQDCLVEVSNVFRVAK